MIQNTHVKIATPGPGYLATSATSATITNSGTVTLTTQANLAYSAGARVRVSYTADSTKWMEGVVSSYAGTTLAFTADTSNGSGTFASWNLNLAGQPGAQTTVAVGATTTGAAGTSASVTNSGTAFAATLNFTIPKGDKGDQGVGYTARGAWASGTTYAQGDMVSYSSVNYYSLQGSNTNHQPDISPTWWQSAAASGLGDPGSNGIIKRTATNTTAPALADDLSAPVYAVAGGTANAITATLSPAITGYVDGARYRIKAANTNTGAATINLNGLGAKTIRKWSGGSLVDVVAGDIAAGQVIDVTYDATTGYMQLGGTVSSAPTWQTLPALTGGWSYQNATTYGQDYAADGVRTYVRAQISGGTQTDGTAIMTLPSGARPTKAVICGVAAVNGSGVFLGYGYLLIGTNGVITITGFNAMTGPFLNIHVNFPIF